MKLSPTKYKILTLVAQGYSDKEIACILKMSPRTVQTHLSKIIAKLDARNRTHAVILYLNSNPGWWKIIIRGKND